MVFYVNYDQPAGDKNVVVKLLGIMKLRSWNVRGKNSVSKRAVMKGLFCCFKGECLFIQETKMEEIDYQIIRSICHWSSFSS